MRCEKCGLYQYGRSLPTAVYDEPYHAGYLRNRARKLQSSAAQLNRIAALTVETPRLLDIGCSLGCLLESACQRGWSAIGVDVSEYAVGYCYRRGLRCLAADADRLPFADRSFDVVTAWHVIEHVADVAATLKEWLRVLRPGGLLALETPNARCMRVRIQGARFRRFWTAEHTYVFSAATLGEFLKRAGFRRCRPAIFGNLHDLKRSQRRFAIRYLGVRALRRACGTARDVQLFARRPAEP